MLAEPGTATPDLLRRDAYPHWRTDVIRFADLDPLGHVNNVAYLTFVESGRVMFFSDLGRSVDRADFTWMTVRLELNYLQQLSLPGTDSPCAAHAVNLARISSRMGRARLSDRSTIAMTHVDVGTGVLEVGRSSVRLSHAVFPLWVARDDRNLATRSPQQQPSARGVRVAGRPL